MVSTGLIISLINFLGFAFGTMLYAMLLAMVVRHPIYVQTTGKKPKISAFESNRILLAAGCLGFLWNIGNLIEIVRHDYWGGESSLFITATTFTALGFLPAAVVHSEQWSENSKNSFVLKLTTGTAYFLSGLAGFLHFQSAISAQIAPSITALQILTVGYLLILAVLFWAERRQNGFWQKSVWMAGIAVFAVSALHLSRPHTEEGSVFIEIIGHQASLPLAFAILYQNFRFAFADLFLKRALSLIFLTAFVLGIYFSAVVPLLSLHKNHPQPDAQSIAVLLGFGVVCGFAYPKLNKIAVWLVDRILLRRAPYERLQSEIMNKISTLEPIEKVLDEVKKTLLAALTAKTAFFEEVFQKSVADALVNLKPNEAEVFIPTAEKPFFQLVLRDFSGGRRLLSDEIEMLETVALHTARRIDALRVTHERCEMELREQEFSKLATEAELRVLRAQINPHFLFNALTTISYLINTAPERAVQTLLQLTGLLRGSLRSTGEFQTLGEELKLIRAYLEIEKARFEERLKVEIDVADEFLSFRIPSLILQPLVENAVKHGISPQKKGGTIRLEAKHENKNFVLEVTDTGAGIRADELRLKRQNRVGLNNVEQRLQLHYNGTANLTISECKGGGTTAQIKFEMPSVKTLEKNRAIAFEQAF